MGLGHFTNTLDDFDPGTASISDNVDGFYSPPALNVYQAADQEASPVRLNLRVTVEPDFDKDGFGDETQDLCTTDPTRQTPCFFADTAGPVITQFSSKWKRFRIKTKGAVIAQRAHPGTIIRLNLSEAANVTFTISKAFRGKITKGVCKKAGRSNRKNRRCTKYILVKTFMLNLASGHNEFFFSGRYRDAKGKVGTLRPGPFRMSATAVDGAGNTGVTEYAAFKIRH
jgi:hypothetical protein